MTLNFKDLNNKVVIDGAIINSVRQKFHKRTQEQIVYFVVAVKRTDYPQAYNLEENNYFYCYASEKLMGGTFLDYIRKTYKCYDNVKIFGILDNMPVRKSLEKEVNARAQHCYLSAISIVDIKKSEKLGENDNTARLVINSLRKQFGKDINVEFEENALEKDFFGLQQDDIPDY